LSAILSTNPIFELNGQYSGSLAMVTDITERKQLEKDIARLDRLSLIGEMAAGIGHEIRNPMTTVKGFLQLYCEKKDFVKYKETFDLMIEELDRANLIITEFLNLAKNKRNDPVKQSLNKIIKAIYPLIQAEAIKNDKEISLELEDLPEQLLDDKEIRQVIHNLVRNGMEAMGQKGCLTIKTFMEGDKVVLAIKDQGRGIEPEVLEKLGTPFFTTKDHGTGLGLAVCYSIAARHNAKIEVDTRPAGTTIKMRFNVT
ncbi:MAG: ATP-binding protein, partial [Desulfotomaculaceae bacterium]